MAEKIAVYPGTFDPMTKGHFDLIVRGAKLYDKLIVAVAATSTKDKAMFSGEERLEMIREDAEKAGLDNVEVKILDTLLVDFCRREGARVVLRGVRVYSDFEYEFQMALTNRKIYPEAETVFLTTAAENMYLSSSLVKQVAQLGGDITDFVPACIHSDIIDKFRKEE